MKYTTISILGCGWLGLPLGAHLVRCGYRVKGSTTRLEKREQLAQAGIEPYLITLDPWVRGVDTARFFEADVLFLNIPPTRRKPGFEAFFREQIESLQVELHYTAIDFVLFASSTSVYPPLNCTVVEEDARHPESDTGRVLLEVEQLLRADTHFDTTVLRFAGLYGYDRQPGRFLAGKQGLTGGDAPVNLIHRDDCIDIVTRIIEQDVRGDVFNACADAHPARALFYRHEAGRLGLEPPTFVAGGTPSYKLVSSEKLKRRVGYRFLHPDPLVPAP